MGFLERVAPFVITDAARSIGVGLLQSLCLRGADRRRGGLHFGRDCLRNAGLLLGLHLLPELVEELPLHGDELLRQLFQLLQSGAQLRGLCRQIPKGINPTAYKSSAFTVIPVAPCLPNGTTQAQFLADPATSYPISYSKWDPGIWYWEYYCLTFRPPALATDPNY